MKKLFFPLIFILVVIFSFNYVNARSGCCSYHGGVCGCGCCDGTSLSATCAPYYPECSGGYSSPSYSYPSYSNTYTSSCPANSYESLGSCKCNSGYIVQGGACVNANNYCKNSDYNSEYDSISKTCKCINNYVIGSSGKCESGDSFCKDKYGYNSSYDSYSNSCKCDSGYYLVNKECKKGVFVSILKDYNSEDKAIVLDSKSNTYLIEYGISCSVRMWKYEQSSSKVAFIEIGGFSIDGISDNLYLIDDDVNCKIWDGKEINIEDYDLKSSSLQKSCPTNSTLNKNDNKCYCNIGYDLSSDSTGCVLSVTCDVNSTKTNNICMCNDGYVLKNSSCISYTDYCKLSFGNNVYGVKGDNNNISCYCNSGYVWDYNKTNCIEDITCPTNSILFGGECKCLDDLEFNSDKTACVNKKIQTNTEKKPTCKVGYKLEEKSNKCIVDTIYNLEQKAKSKGKEKIAGLSKIKLYKNIEKIGSSLWGNKK